MARNRRGLVLVLLLVTGCSESVPLTEHQAAVEAAAQREATQATTIDQVNAEIADLTGQIESLEARVEVAEGALQEGDQIILELESEIRSMRIERDEAVEQSTALLLAFDAQIQAARSELHSELIAYVCQQAYTDAPPSSVDSAIDAYLNASPESAASLAGFDLDAIIDRPALQTELDRCKLDANLRTPKGDGFYTVGFEIAPGRWESTGTGDGCYWARLTVNQDIIDNHFGIAGGTVTIRPSDYEIRFDGCGTWEFVG